jgi:hypothetical protein
MSALGMQRHFMVRFGSYGKAWQRTVGHGSLRYGSRRGLGIARLVLAAKASSRRVCSRL